MIDYKDVDPLKELSEEELAQIKFPTHEELLNALAEGKKIADEARSFLQGRTPGHYL